LKEIDYKGQKIATLTQAQYIAIKTEELAAQGIVLKPRFKRSKEGSSNNNRNKKQKKGEESTPRHVKEEPESNIEKGLLIEIKNVPTDIPHAEFKAYFARFGNVQFVDMSKVAEQTIIVRFINNAATEAAYAEISEKKMDIKGNILDGRMITGEEEENYWKEHILPSLKKKS